MLRFLIVVIIVAAGAWSAYWFVSAKAWERGLTAWMEERRAAGWQADWSDIEVRGFPNRLDTTINDIALADTASGWSWQAPFVQILSLSYRPTQAIVVLPNDTTLQTVEHSYRLQGDDIRASLALEPNRNLALERATAVIEGGGVTVDGNEGWTAREMRMAVERTDDTPTYRLGLALSDVQAPEGVGPAGALAQVTADATATFDTVWDLRALEQARPQPVEIRIDRADASWGALEVAMAGEVTVSDSGTPEGTVTVKVKNWRDILDLAVQTGILPESMLPTFTRALELASGLSGNPDTLDMPLNLRGGRVFLGPLPIATAPNLSIR